MQLNEEQRLAVEHPLDRPACLIAGAGSGKTRVLTERVRWLMDNGVVPNRICAITFTNKAAGEMVRRLDLDSATGLVIPRVSTIHSLALGAIRKNPKGFGLKDKVTPLDDYDQKQMVKKVIDRHNFEEDTTSLMFKLLEKISFHRARGIGFHREYTDDVHEQALRMHAGYYAMNETELDLWEEFEQEKQCHPPGTPIRVVIERYRCAQRGERWFIPAKTEDRPIEQLRNGDLVVSWRRQDGRTIYKGRPVTVASRNYRGDMLVISTEDGKKVQVTPDHLVWTRFNEQVANKHVVYLMYRNDLGFRVGTATVRKRSGSRSYGGLSQRMNTEKAEKGWILNLCDTELEARIQEEIYTIKYGIPQVVFEPSNISPPSYAVLIKAVFRAADSRGARRCLKDHGLLEQYPLVQRTESKPMHAPGRFFKTAACNLIPTFMNLPAVTRPVWSRDGKQHKWRMPDGICVSSVSRERYSGKVYSLEVADDHTYIADGIIVGNCQSVVDFDDMLHYVVRRMRTDERWLAVLHKQFDHVLMDEGQDTSPVQWEFINGLLHPEKKDMYVVGDISQSIYAFNGALPELLMNYSKEWRGVQPVLYKIQRNHRSVPEIVDFANLICGKMKMTIPIQMESWRGINNEHGEVRKIVSAYPQSIAGIIAQEIQRDTRNGIAYKDNAILVRTGIQIRDLEGELIRRRIPYVVRGGRGLLATEEIRDIMAYMRLAANRKDFMAFVRATGAPRCGVGEATLEKLRQQANEKHGGDLIQAAREQRKLGMFCDTIEHVSMFKDSPVAAVEKVVAMSNYKEYIRRKYKKEPGKVQSKLENVERFNMMVIMLVQEGNMGLDDLIFNLTLDRPKGDEAEEREAVMKAYDEGKIAKDELDAKLRVLDQGSVTVTTIHSAKGLEFLRVYVTNVTEGSLPHMFSSGDAEEIEEERRLLYVACTRAKDKLVICVPQRQLQRGRDGQMKDIKLTPSRFLLEIGA